MTTIKVSDEVRDKLKALGVPERLTADEVVRRLIDSYERAEFWNAFDAAASTEPLGGGQESQLVEQAALSDLRHRDG